MLTRKGLRRLLRKPSPVLAAAVLGFPVVCHGASETRAPVRVWQDTITLPTYEIGPPDPNPPFDYFVQDYRYNYPYPTLGNLTGHSAPRTWRALNLENEFIKCTVLPDLGGHVYGCRDKRSGAEMFYANPSLKFARLAHRGAWAAVGVEFNFPVSHNWMSVSPVDFSTATGPDGSASIWVGNQDRVDGMRWQVEIKLRPGQAVLEEHIALDNPDSARHRFYWWTNAGVEVRDDSKLYYPQQYSVFHGFTDLDTWPVNAAGIDLSVVGNQKYGPVSRFSYGSAEPYMGIYHPDTHAGLVHYSSQDNLPAKKIWSWGTNAEARKWRDALSDNHSAYAEIQAGLFHDQETHAFLDPQQHILFSEYWIPIRNMEEITYASAEGVLSMTRKPTPDPGRVSLPVSLNVTREFPGAEVSLRRGSETLFEESVSLSPRSNWGKVFEGLPSGGTYTFTATGADGRTIIQHTEGQYEFTPKSELPAVIPDVHSYPPVSERSEGEFAQLGDEQERDGRLLDARATYAAGLERFPLSIILHRALGRLEVALMRYAAACNDLQFVVERVSTDREASYYLGLAQRMRGDLRGARRSLEVAQQFGTFRPAARFELAALAAHQGQLEDAQYQLNSLVAETPEAVRATAMSVALLRIANKTSLAKERVFRLREVAPTDSFVRYEAIRLGREDPTLWQHLAADPERILEIAAQYMKFGLYGEALGLLDRQYPASAPGSSDPGTPSPAQYPLIAYYRGFCREALGKDGAVDFAAASALPLDYVFPNRPEELEILRRAIAVNTQDASAHFLLGALLMQGGQAEEALAEWELARRIRPEIPALLRSMGYAVLLAGKEPERALQLFNDGIRFDPNNPGNYLGLEKAMRMAGRPVNDRIRALNRFPANQTMPSDLVFQRARDLAEAGRFVEAQQELASHFVAREEGGIGLREVYLDIRMQQAQQLSHQARCDAARKLLQHISDGVPDLGLTSDELTVELGSQSRKRERAAIEDSCKK